MNDRVSRRAGLYVAVLTSAVIVSVAGLAGLLAARVQIRTAADSGKVIEAQFYALSALEMAIQGLETDPLGYVRPADPGWQAALPMRQGSCEWRILEKSTGEVADAVLGRLRLQGKGVVGDAARIVGVELEATDTSATDNIVTAGDMETVTAWTQSGACDEDYVQSYSGLEPHAGDWFLVIRNRDEGATVLHDVTAKLTNDTTWEMSAWAATKDYAERVTFVFMYKTLTDSGFTFVRLNGQTALKEEWVEITGTQAISWTGTLESAYFGVSLSGATSDQEFMLDDLSLSVASAPTIELQIIPGSWSQDVE